MKVHEIKRIGIYSMLIFSSFFGAVYLIFYFVRNNRPVDGMWWILLVIAILFFKVVTISAKEIKIYRPFWFLFKCNSIKIDEISRVTIFINNSTGGSVTMTFFDENNKPRLDFLCQFYKFEIRRLIKTLNQLGIETELKGTGSIGFD